MTRNQSENADGEELNRSESLRGILKSIGAVYNEGDPVDVELTDGPSAAVPDGETVRINPDVSWADEDTPGAARLAATANTLSHEIEHLRESELESKREFMEARPEGATVAGAVVNILEDQYIDRTRTERWRGLTDTQRFVVDTLMNDDERRPPMGDIDGVTGQMIEGLTQAAFAGNVKGLADADADVQQFLGWARDRIDAVRHEPDPEAREEIAGEVYDTMKAVAEKHGEFDPEAGAEHVVKYVPGGEEIAEEGEEVAADAETDAELDDFDDDEDGDGGSGDGEGDDEDGEGDGDGSGEGDEDEEADGDGGSGADGDTDADADSDAAARPGSDDAGGQTADLDADEIQDAVDEMLDSDPTNSANWYDADPDEEPDISDFARRFERLQEMERLEQTDMGQRRADRSDLIRRNQQSGELTEQEHRTAPETSHAHDAVEQDIRKRDLDREIEEAFRLFTTADDHIPSREGERINMPAAVEFAAGNFGRDDLFLTSKPVEHGDRVVGVTLDTSGSMGGSMLDAKVALGAFQLATAEIGDTFIANTFHAEPGRGSVESEDDVHSDLIVGPEESWDWEFVDAAVHGGETPTSYGMADMRELMDDTPAREKLMVVVTDGDPNVVSGVVDGGKPHNTRASDEAVEETAAYTAALREDGYTVIGVAVNDGVRSRLMDAMFGEEAWTRTDAEGLAATLVEIYRRALNQEAGHR